MRCLSAVQVQGLMCYCALLWFAKPYSIEAGLQSDMVLACQTCWSVQAVQIDPDAEAGEADNKSAAAALCGGPPKAEKAFDF